MAITVATDDLQFNSLSTINVLLGKNGCGKSRALKALERSVRRDSSTWSAVRYVTPERGGYLAYEPNIDQQMKLNGDDWFSNSRLVNQSPQFKAQTIALFRELELGVYRTLESDLKAGKEVTYFSTYLDQINALLDNIHVVSEGTNATFKIFRRSDGVEVNAEQISSGESELIALAIETLVFVQDLGGGRGLLLIDEPDVHIHPDLQTRLMLFLLTLVDRHPIEVIVSTHSTALLGALAERNNTAISTMTAGQTDLTFEPIDAIYADLLPVFGAHPLTQVYSESPILIVEGEDDVRIWEQVVRSARGAIKLYPVACGGTPFIHSYEQRAESLLRSVYDYAVGFSLRDSDGVPGELDDMTPLVRLKLACRNSENLLLTEEVLSSCQVTWDGVSAAIDDWVSKNPSHSKYEVMASFAVEKNRKEFDLKAIRMILVGQILGSTKPWEVLVGQALGELASAGLSTGEELPHTLRAYLGPKSCEHLLA